MSQDGDRLLAEGIAAFNRQLYTDARELLTDAVLANPLNLRAWIWLSAALPDAAERRFSLNYVLKHEPNNPAARQGLQTIPAQTLPKAPFQMQVNGLPFPRCQALGCRNQVSNPQHPLCRQHWKSVGRDGQPPREATSAPLTASMLGEQLNIASNRVNLMLAEIGWLDRDGAGWRCTAQGQAAGGVQRVHQVSGVSFVV